jgi:germination protein M
LAIEGSSDTGAVFTENRIHVTVYYQDSEGYLIPMTRWIQFQQGIGRAAVSLCIDSAIAREEVAYYGVYPVIPVNTEILGIDIREGIATIDFNRHLLNYTDAAAERNIIASIVYMLTEFKTISKVRILINGYQQEILKYGTNVSKALGREDISINVDAPLIDAGSGKVDVFLFKKANEGFTYLVPVSVAD